MVHIKYEDQIKVDAVINLEESAFRGINLALQGDELYDDLKNKTVIVSGASQGIGLAIAERFCEEGSIVFNLDVKEPEKNDSHSRYIRCDVSSSEQVHDAVVAVAEASGRVDVVVNNAGIEEYYALHETPVEKWDKLMGVNLRGPYLLTKEAIPHMLKTGGGVVLFTASVQSSVVQKRDAAYVTSKHALLGLARSVAVDYAPLIRAVALCPGTIITPLQISCARQEVGDDPQKIQQKLEEWGRMCPMGREGDASEVANVAAFMASKQASYVTGAAIYIDGGLGAYLPESVPESKEGGE